MLVPRVEFRMHLQLKKNLLVSPVRSVKQDVHRYEHLPIDIEHAFAVHMTMRYPGAFQYNHLILFLKI